MKKDSTYKYIKKLLALPLFPWEHISSTFEKLQSKASDQLQPLTYYVKETWMDGALWHPEDLSVYGQSVQTNNDVEGMYKCT